MIESLRFLIAGFFVGVRDNQKCNFVSLRQRCVPNLPKVACGTVFDNLNARKIEIHN